ncbi:hypothetical protein H2201_006702 [Coniosporium apollinis]|uniref:Uncharacterized protein n=1 Tax=Coniosporium apollinis TaxID=61459 RepID=A0ABQ9NRE0_9PEZI|nr:hypothetical protein H2201_006702 [Coniosporium apollinis]
MQFANVFRPDPSAPHDPHEANPYEPYTTSLQQRQQQAQQFYSTQARSRPSSSSGSAPHTLRRTPNFEDRTRGRPRASSFDDAQRPQQSVRFADDTQRSGEASAGNQPYRYDTQDPRAPHPALRISRRTASAILYALEEAIRTPYPFTPDLAEENASMSDLLGGPTGNGRATNGGSRAAQGPVPVPQPTQPPGVRTPRDIMNQRREREQARKQQKEAEAAAARIAEEQARAQSQADERRKSAERRAAAAGVAGQSRDSGGYRRPMDTAGGRTSGDSGYGGYTMAPAQGPGITGGYDGPVNPPPAASRPPDPGAGTRPRASTHSQAQPQAVPASSAAPQTTGRRAVSQPQQQTHARQPSGTGGTSQQARAGPSAVPSSSAQPHAGAPPTADGAGARSTASSFPHAFERWETLSSHWEGLTSYWIRRLEQNTEEVRREPLVQQMSRQITDLSAAGANLFHAVVELQRLRASSERKFQRWFFETRQEQERAQEMIAQLESQLQAERAAKQEAEQKASRSDNGRRNSDKLLAELKRELQISREEARRAWEELGRREQEERERTMSLREGQPTWVGGVQVFPSAGGMASRHGSVSQRPTTREGPYQTGGPQQSTPGGPQGTSEQGYSYEEGASPTDTDPFTESAQQRSQLRHEPDISSLNVSTYAPHGIHPTSSNASSGSTARPTTGNLPPQQQSQASAGTSIPASSQRAVPSFPAPTTSSAQHTPTTPTAQQFYQHTGTFLHTGAGPPSPPAPHEERDESGSYVMSNDDDIVSQGEDEDEWLYDRQGNPVLDDHGNRVPYSAAAAAAVGRMRGTGRSEAESDEYDVQSDLAREAELRQHYGGVPATMPAASTAYTQAGAHTQAGAYSQSGAAYAQPTSGAPGYGAGYGPPDYSGSGYGDEWSSIQRHHHPTRLSDVLEEDERSRTSPSRASQTSRGMEWR